MSVTATSVAETDEGNAGCELELTTAEYGFLCRFQRQLRDQSEAWYHLTNCDIERSTDDCKRR